MLTFNYEMSHSSIVFKIRSQKRRYVKQSLIILIMVSSGLFLNFSTANSNDYEIVDVKIDSKTSIQLDDRGSDSYYSKNQEQNHIRSNTNAIAGSNSLQTLDSFTPNGALLATESEDAGSGFEFSYNETFFDDSTNTGMGNDTSFAVQNGYGSYNNLAVDVDAYTQEANFLVEDDTGPFIFFNNNQVYAQGTFLPNLNDSGTSISLDYFEVSYNTAAQADLNMTGAIYNSTTYLSNVVPDKEIARTNITTTLNANLIFNFGSAITIPQSNTYNNDTGSFIFFVIYWSNGTSGSWLLDSVNDGGAELDDGPTYVASNGPPPTPPANNGWGPLVTYDLVIKYNASYTFDPQQIDTYIEAPQGGQEVLIGADGLFSESVSRTSNTNYQLWYNKTLSDGLFANFSVSYESYAYFLDTTTVIYTATPEDPNIMWNNQFISTYVASSSVITKYFILPNNFTNLVVFHDMVILDEAVGNYTTSLDASGNKLVFIEVGSGNYTITANSTNVLYDANLRSDVQDGGWQQRSNGTMGTMYPNALVGDNVRGFITNIGTLDLASGNYNGSLRTENGLILPFSTVTGYTDTSSFSSSTPYVATMSFETFLDPNIPTGFWSFQFRWFNGTAAGVVALEFAVLPYGTIELLNPTATTLDVVETETIFVQVATLDNSHNTSWASGGSLNWELATVPMSDDGQLNGSHFFFSYTIDTQISTHEYEKKSYLFTISFTDGPFTITTEFEVTIFYRADTQVNFAEPVEYFSPIEIIFAPLNMTGDQSEFNITGIAFELTSNPSQTALSFNSVYDPTPGRYNISIAWSDQFFLGSGNEIQLNWTLAGFKSDNIAEYSLSYVPYSFSFQTDDTVKPVFDVIPNDIIVDEFVSGINLTWNASDPNPATYTYQIDGGLASSPVAWDNFTQVVLSIESLLDQIPNSDLTGDHFISVRILDNQGNFEDDIIKITVNDSTDPIISSPPILNNTIVAEGSISESLNWTAIDNHNSTYSIYQNGNPTPIQTGNWANDSAVTYVINPTLTVGVYEFKIQMFDESLNYVNHTAYVTVIDNTDPAVGAFGDVTYEEFTQNNEISWTPIDSHPQNYTLFIDGVLDTNTTWTSGVTIDLDIDGLPLGTTTYLITFFDQSGNSVSDSVIVTVEDTAIPTVTHPDDITYTLGNQDNEISWDPSDTHPDSFTIYLNQAFNTSGVWSSSPIVIDIDGLGIGRHNFTIQVEDTTGNVVYDTVFVTVLDPDITYTSLVPFDIKNNVYEGDVETISILGWITELGLNITDAQLNATLFAIDVDDPSNGTIIYQTLISSTVDAFDLILDYSGLLNGTYQWIFTFEKAEFETQITPSLLYQVVIHLHTLKIDILFDSTLVQSEEFFISANVTYDNPIIADGLSLNAINSLKSANNITVFFVITAINDAGTEVIFNKQGVTDANGFVRVSLDTLETESLADIISIGANIDALAGYTGTFSETRTDLKLKIEEGSEFFGLLDDIYNFIVEQIIIFAIILTIIIIVIIYFLRRLRKRRSKFTMYARESEDASAEIDGLRSMHGIIMTAGSTGIPFYEYTFTSARTSIDSALISGITTALSMFLNELNEQVLGFEHMERAGVSITSHKSDLSTMMVISDAPLPPIILEQLKNGHHAIESKFSKQLMIPERMMDIEPINITNELVSKSLKLNLKEDVIIRTNNLKKLQKRKSISRKIRNDMGLLKKLNKLSDDTHEPLNLEMILAYLESSNIDHATACRIIYLSYVNFIIVPI